MRGKAESLKQKAESGKQKGARFLKGWRMNNVSAFAFWLSAFTSLMRYRRFGKGG